MKRIRHGGDHRVHRAISYPQLGDQLDAIAAGFDALRTAGITLPDKTVRWLDECRLVKTRFRPASDQKEA